MSGLDVEASCRFLPSCLDTSMFVALAGGHRTLWIPDEQDARNLSPVFFGYELAAKASGSAAWSIDGDNSLGPSVDDFAAVRRAKPCALCLTGRAGTCAREERWLIDAVRSESSDVVGKRARRGLSVPKNATRARTTVDGVRDHCAILQLYCTVDRTGEELPQPSASSFTEVSELESNRRHSRSTIQFMICRHVRSMRAVCRVTDGAYTFYRMPRLLGLSRRLAASRLCVPGAVQG